MSVRSEAQRVAAGSLPAVLRGYGVVQLAWLATTAMAIAAFGASLVPAWHNLHIRCNPATDCVPQLTVQGERTLAHMGISLDLYAAYFLALYTVFAAVYVAIAGVILWRRPADRIAIFSAFFLVLEGTVAFPWTVSLLSSYPAPWPQISTFLTIGSQACTVSFFYTFPTGRFIPRWTVILVVVWVLALVPGALAPGSPLSLGHLPGAINALLFLGCFCPLPVVLVYRYRRVGNVIQQQQIKWVVFGIAAAFLFLICMNLLFVGTSLVAREHNSPLLSATYQTLVYLGMLLIPVSIGAAIVRYHLWDIDLIINRTLTWVSLSAIVAGLYSLIVASLATIFQAHGSFAISLLAAGCVAVLFQPLRDRLQRGVNHLLYGNRHEPYAVLSRVAEGLEHAVMPESALQMMVDAMADALKLPYVAIQAPEDDKWTIAASHGVSAADVLCLPLTYAGVTVGQLQIAARSGASGFAPKEVEMLRHLARHIGPSVRAARLTRDLQRSRQRLVTAREEERRRLRRDLHDGLGPRLASLTLRLETARDRLSYDVLAEELLADLSTRTQEAVTEIRRVVYALRPPALDDLGLMLAVRESVTEYGERPEMVVTGPASLPPLPAAVEVAAYSIVQEAVANVVRHAGARTCTVSLALNAEQEALQVEIIDDGKGIGMGQRAGVGMSSMRERAEELGGMLVVEPTAGGGTTVRAWLPYDFPGAVATDVRDVE